MAQDFTFKIPTKVIYQENVLSHVGELLLKEKYRKIVLIYGGNHSKEDGTLDLLLKSLCDSKIEFQVYSGVVPNPDISFVNEVLPKIKKYEPEFILAFGGGSVLDTVKLLAALYYYSGNSLDFNSKVAVPSKALPFGSIMTIAASGSEMSSSCVISSRATNFKGGFNAPTNYPTLAIIDPTLTLTLGAYQTACGIVDIFSHSFERYYSASGAYEFSDELALATMKAALEAGEACLKDLHNLDCRRAVFFASTFSHNGWTSFGKPYKMTCHFVEHLISGRYPLVAHGAGLAVLMPEYLIMNRDLFAEKIKKMGRVLFNLDDVTDIIDKLRDTFVSFKMPVTYKELDPSLEMKARDLNSLLKIK